MLSSREELEKVLQGIVDLPVLVVGDVVLDRYIWGNVERISPEAPVPVLDVQRSEDRLGGAGNVARNLRNIGAKVTLCALIGDDDEGRTVLSLLEKDGISPEGVVIDRARPTTIKTRIMAQRQQIVRIDRENRASQALAQSEAFAALVEAHIGPAKAIVVSDYGKGAISSPVLKRLSGSAASAKVGSRPLMVDPHPRNYENYESIGMAKPNRKEAEAASGIRITSRETALEAARILIQRWSAQMIVLSLGEDGLLIMEVGKSDGIFMPTVARQVFDVSGAGDTVSAVFTSAIATGASPLVAGDLANIAAGVVVSEIGTVPVNLQKLHQEIALLSARKVATTG